MTLNIRRVVTGHDAQGRSTVLIDEQVKNQHSPRPGATYSVIWSTEELPASNDGSDDPSNKAIPTAIADGSVFRVVSFGPGAAQPPHRLDRLRRGHFRRDRHGDGDRHRAAQSRRRHGPARHDPRLGE